MNNRSQKHQYQKKSQNDFDDKALQNGDAGTERWGARRHGGFAEVGKEVYEQITGENGAKQLRPDVSHCPQHLNFTRNQDTQSDCRIEMTARDRPNSGNHDGNNQPLCQRDAEQVRIMFDGQNPDEAERKRTNQLGDTLLGEFLVHNLASLGLGRNDLGGGVGRRTHDRQQLGTQRLGALRRLICQRSGHAPAHHFLIQRQRQFTFTHGFVGRA